MNSNEGLRPLERRVETQAELPATHLEAVFNAATTVAELPDTETLG